MAVSSQAFGLGEHLGLRDAVCYGGVPRRGQQQELRRGVELLIATPGRLLDFVNAKVTFKKQQLGSRFLGIFGILFFWGFIK